MGSDAQARADEWNADELLLRGVGDYGKPIGSIAKIGSAVHVHREVDIRRARYRECNVAGEAEYTLYAGAVDYPRRDSRIGSANRYPRGAGAGDRAAVVAGIHGVSTAQQVIEIVSQ